MSESKEEFWARAIFRVAEVEASIAYYRDKLGFVEGWRGDGATLVIAAVERGGLQIILDAGSSLPRPPARSVLSLTLHAHEGLATLHRDLTARGAKVLAAPFAVSWQPGIHQFEVEDLDGNVLCFWGDGLGS